MSKYWSPHSDYTDRERRKCILNVMPDKLRRIAREAMRKERELDLLELETRYRWAKELELVHAFCNDYGDDAVDQLLRLRSAGDWHVAVYLAVALYIEDSFFQRIVEFNKSERARLGHITWKHLVTFAGVADEQEKERLLKRCMRENWSHDTLLKAVGLLTVKNTKNPGQADKELNISSTTRGIATRAKNLCQKVALFFDERLPLSVQKIPMMERADAAVRLLTARNSLLGCIVRLNTAVAAIDSVLEILLPQKDRPDAENQSDNDGRPRLPQVKKDATEGVA